MNLQSLFSFKRNKKAIYVASGGFVVTKKDEKKCYLFKVTYKSFTYFSLFL